MLSPPLQQNRTSQSQHHCVALQVGHTAFSYGKQPETRNLALVTENTTFLLPVAMDVGEKRITVCQPKIRQPYQRDLSPSPNPILTPPPAAFETLPLRRTTDSRRYSH